MDVTSVDEVVISSDPDLWQPGDSWLAGGTVLYSYGTDITRGAPSRLLDITSAGWEPTRWTVSGSGVPELEIAATCRVTEIHDFRVHQNIPDPQAALPGLDLFAPCCDSFVASWKIWNISTVGGNVATALPAGPMISLLVGLDAEALLLAPGGASRTMPVVELVTGEAKTALVNGELIRSFHIPLPVLKQPCSFRRISLTERGRSAALVTGRLIAEGQIRLAITASTRRPYVVDVDSLWAGSASIADLHRAIDRTVADDWHDDIHGSPQWREAMTHRLSEEILVELLTPESSGHRVSGDITMTRSSK